MIIRRVGYKALYLYSAACIYSPQSLIEAWLITNDRLWDVLLMQLIAETRGIEMKTSATTRAVPVGELLELPRNQDSSNAPMLPGIYDSAMMPNNPPSSARVGACVPRSRRESSVTSVGIRLLHKNRVEWVLDTREVTSTFSCTVRISSPCITPAGGEFSVFLYVGGVENGLILSHEGVIHFLLLNRRTRWNDTSPNMVICFGFGRVHLRLLIPAASGAWKWKPHRITRFSRKIFHFIIHTSIYFTHMVQI